MFLSLLSPTSGKTVIRESLRQGTKFAGVCLVLIFCGWLLLSSGCTRRREDNTTPTQGSIAVFASPAVYSVVQRGADEFNRLYVNANVNVYALDSRAIVDSILQNRVDVGYFDRQFMPAESIAVAQKRRRLNSFHLGSTVATWLVHPQNEVAALDSQQCLRVLTGAITSWRELGGADREIHLILPPLGDGAWAAIQDYFGAALTNVAGHYWENDSLVFEQVAQDANALGLVGHAVSANPKVKKLRWQHPLLADPAPANIGALQEGKYPFKVRLMYYTVSNRLDLAAGFISFMTANQGQRIIADSDFLPEMVPVRIVNLAAPGDQK